MCSEKSGRSTTILLAAAAPYGAVAWLILILLFIFSCSFSLSFLLLAPGTPGQGSQQTTEHGPKCVYEPWRYFVPSSLRDAKTKMAQLSFPTRWWWPMRGANWMTKDGALDEPESILWRYETLESRIYGIHRVGDSEWVGLKNRRLGFIVALVSLVPLWWFSLVTPRSWERLA